MRLRDAPFAALAALSLASAPSVAAAAPVDVSRSSASVEGEQLGGATLAWGMAALIAVLTGILVFSDDDEETPVSP